MSKQRERPGSHGLGVSIEMPRIDPTTFWITATIWLTGSEERRFGRAASPPDNAVWLRLLGVDLDNGTADRKSDSVQTVQRWKPKKVSAFQNLQPHQCNEALDLIEAGCEPGVRFTRSRRGGSSRWAGAILMQRYHLDERQAAQVITVWLETGLLIESYYVHPIWRRTTSGVQVDNATANHRGTVARTVAEPSQGLPTGRLCPSIRNPRKGVGASHRRLAGRAVLLENWRRRTA
jgi:hypothetical protein